ncbi:MAG: GNAT family N-acetyltransferase [Clostridia bacterium]|nr:GNAT family N-acetyltransferase [Clostridia bacterium]
MNLHIRRFSELSADELYGILRLRIAVFVVEQECTYMETDGLDQDAIHVWLEDEDGIQAYLRVLDRGVESEYCAIGRVVAAKRRRGLGSLIMKEGIRAAREVFGADAVYLEAQTYALPFYERLGFRRISDEFILDGIPHVRMLLETGPENR